MTEQRSIGTSLPSALVRRLGHQPPRPSPSRSRDTDSEASDRSDGDSDSDESRSSGGGRSKKKRLRMRMYADEEEEKSRRSMVKQRLKEVDAELNGKNRPVHTRLGPSRTADLATSPPASGMIDLRQRLCSPSASKSPIDSEDDNDSENGDGPRLAANSNHTRVDLRSKIRSRLGAK